MIILEYVQLLMIKDYGSFVSARSALLLVLLLDMKKRFRPFIKGYLCPICVVKFPYHEKFTEHWKRFHGRSAEKKFRSSPPLCYAATKGHRHDENCSTPTTTQHENINTNNNNNNSRKVSIVYLSRVCLSVL